MKALGMIEVYGYLAAVEALDSALKAANVSLLDVVCVKGGLVSVLVTGDVGATKAAMDASAAAAERVGRVISVHVIPRPADDIERMLGNGPKGPERPRDPDLPIGSTEEPEAVEPDAEPEAQEVITPEPEVQITEAPEPEAQPENEPDSEQETEQESEPETVDPHTLTPEEMQEMTVSRLRAIVRGLGGCNMTRKAIRFAKKEELIAGIQKFCEQEG